jgi:hypothetical protein
MATFTEGLDMTIPETRTYEIQQVILRFGALASGGSVVAAAVEWRDLGFNADEVERWLEARCFDPDFAATLRQGGYTPTLAGERTEMGLGAACSRGDGRLAAPDPDPARALRIELARRRAAGVPFERAWSQALVSTLKLVPGGKNRASWRSAFRATRTAWKAGWNRSGPQPLEALALARDDAGETPASRIELIA